LLILCAGINTVVTDAAAESVDEVEQQLSFRLNLFSDPDRHHEQARYRAFEFEDCSCDISGMIGSGHLLSPNFELSLTRYYSS
jgi:hypothetical protein